MPSRKLEYQITGRDFATPAFNSVQASIQRTESRLQGIQSTALRLRTTFAGLTFTGFGAGIALRDAGRLETTLIRLQGISNNFATDQQFLIDQSRSLGLTISDLAENFQQLAVLEKIELLDPGQARLLTVGFEEAAKAFGTSSTDIQLAIRGIRQALTQEVVRAQEFDQIFDALGAIQPAVARQLGITTKEFQQLRGSGNLLAKDLVDALIPALNEYEGSAARAAKSIDGSFRLIGNAYQNILLAFNEDISDNFQGAASVIAGSLDAISNNAETISESLGIATTAILAGFGGRAVGAMVNFANQQERAATVSRAHSLALVENERRNIELVRSQAPVLKSEADAARARLQSLQSTRAVLTSESALKENRRQIERATRQLTAANRAYNASLDSGLASVGRFEAASNGAAVGARALSTATRGVSAAMGLVGGPIGIAAIALGTLVVKYREATQLTREFGKAIENAERAFAIGDQAEIAEIERQRLEVQQEITRLQFDQVRAQERVNRESGNFSIDLLSAQKDLNFINFEISTLQQQLDSLNVDEQVGRQLFAIRSEIERMQSGQISSTSETLKDFTSVLDKIFPNREKIQSLKDLRAELESIRGSISPAEYARAADELDQQIAKYDDVAIAAKKAADEQARQLDSLSTLRRGVLDEVGRLKADFESNENAILKLNVQLGDRFSDAEASTLIAQYREQFDAKVRELDQKRHEEELARLDDQRRERQRIFDESVDLRRQNNEALAIVNPVAGLQAAYDLERDILEKNIFENDKLLEGAEVRRAALRIQYARDTQEAINQLARDNPSQLSLTDFLNTDVGLDSAFSATSNLLSALTRDTDAYIDIQDTWTDAEKKRAELSNRINRQQFERNKKFQIAQAIIEGSGAVQKAWNSAPYPLNALYAGIVAGGVAKQISTIKKTSFGSSGSVSFGGTGASSGTLGTSTGSSDVATLNGDGGGTIVYMVNSIPANLEQGINKRWLMEQQRSDLKELVANGAVSASDNIEIIVSDVPVPTLMRRNSALASV